MRVEQVVRSAAEKAASKATAEAKKRRAPSAKRRPGRPPGSKNTSKADVRLTPELLRITHRVEALLKLSAGLLPLTYLVLDGHFGNHTARQMVQPWGVQLISKLRSDSALYLPDNGPYAGRGPHRQ